MTVEGTKVRFLVDLAKYSSATSLKERLLGSFLDTHLKGIQVSQVSMAYQVS